MSRAGRFGWIAGVLAFAALAGAAVMTGGGAGAGPSGGTSLAQPAQAGVATAGVAGAAMRSPVAGLPPAAAAAGGEGTWIVVFREPALGAYRGGIANLPEPRRTVGARGKARLDVSSAQSRNYVSYLRGRQSKLQGDIERRIGRPLAVRLGMQHAVNGIVVDMAAAEADRVRDLPEVLLVEEYREYLLDTDVGPALVGAEPVWTGTNPGAPAAYQGEGIVFGILDSGINWASPSFAAVSAVDGYQHLNPLGSGNFLGTCLAGGVDAGRCNDKLIGGYDFVCGAPGNQCGVANVREEPGFGDTNGHGSHTASTAGGNRRDVQFGGHDLRISGVAPRANIVAFDICYTNTATGQGLCPNVSAVAAVNQAIADGVVDVINYSIGGGSQPWSEAVSLAFLNAVDAGIYIAASAGNSGPGPNTMGHLEPWVSSTAASQHGRGDFLTVLEVTGPAPVPEPLTAVIMNPGSNGVAQTVAIPGTSPLVVSPGIDTAADGCSPSPYPANSLTGAVVVIRRGTCGFSEKVNNAAAAGAIAVVIANNAAGGIIPSVPDTGIPAFGIQQADGDALRNFANANPGAVTAGIPYPAIIMTNTPDALGAFSSRGPAGSFDLLKPDVTAPGVRVLAVSAGTTLTGFENLIALLNGTSMASPHQAGAAGLVRQARPDWTVPEIKSALAMTADRTVLLEDQVTPATPFGAGSGRIRVDKAINAGLVLHETAANYLAANPATGGQPSTLNQPSLASARCFTSCTFQRTFRNTQSRAMTWRVRLEGLPGRTSGANLKFAANGTATLNVLVDSKSLPADGSWHFGTVVLEPATSGSNSPTLHLPVAVSVPPPAIVLPALTSASQPVNRIGSTMLAVGNAGGSTLHFDVDNTGTAGATLADAPRGAVNTGFNSSFLTDNVTPALFAADDFTLAGSTNITSVYVEGFTAASISLLAATTQLGWSIFPDAGGVPAGNPQTSPGAAAWSYLAAPGSAGITISNSGQINNIRLDLVAAGQNVTLPAGRYWLVVHARTTTANRWLWFGSNDGSGGFMTITPGAAGTGSWTANTTFSGLAMGIQGAVGCGAPWLGAVAPPVGSVAPGASRSLRVQLNSFGMSPGTHVANMCVSSNDPARPKTAAPISFTVTP